MFIRFLSVLFALLISCTSAHAGDYTKDDAVKMVEKAAAFLKANGKEKLIAEVGKKDGPFHKGELYVYVTDLNYTMLAHPANPKLVGKSNLDVPDVDGKFYRKEMIELAKTKGSGWVDYKYKNPESGKVEAKTSYVLKAEDLMLVCGIYK